jgi:hypothetical protein
MPSPAWEDLDDFLDPEDFGDQAIITLQAGGTIPLSVIFDEPGMTANLRDFDHDTAGPKATCRENKVAAVRRGDSITIQFRAGARTFDILKTPQPDGTGLAVLDLAQ